MVKIHTRDRFLQDLIPVKICVALENAGYHSKPDLRNATKQQLMLIEGMKKEYVDIIQEWISLPKYQPGDLIVIRGTHVITVNGDNGEEVIRDFVPGDVIPAPFASRIDLESQALAVEHYDMLPTVRERQKHE